jgi:hypothetical protein
MRTYDTDKFEVVFNGNLVAIEDCEENLISYIIARYVVDRHYEHNGERFFVIQTESYDQDEFCKDMDDFCDISEASDDELFNHINSLLAIASPAVKERIYDHIGKIPRNVQDAGTVKQSDVQKEQSDVSKPKPKPRTNDSII